MKFLSLTNGCAGQVVLSDQQFGYIYDGFFTEEEAANYASLKGQEGGIPEPWRKALPLWLAM